MNITDYAIKELTKSILINENRCLIKLKDGSFREETDEEFRNRLTNKYSEKVENGNGTK